ncbi:MAG: phosphogluconate dehydrogenase (NAD(+)-dependent, decarboxylating) [Minisyncoccia bacterium]
MNIGIIGLGRMGMAIAKRAIQHNHTVSGFAPSIETRDLASTFGVTPYESIPELVSNLQTPRTVWLMVPAGEITRSTITILAKLLEAGDTVIDGGNSYFKDSQAQAELLESKSINFIDVGTSGGLKGEQIGFSLMIGGQRELVNSYNPLWEALAAPDAYTYIGPAGSGHFVKMVHNGVEYGIMQAMAEGFELVKNGPYPNLDLQQVSKVWKNGSIIRSFLMDLAYDAFQKDTNLDSLTDYVDDNGMGRWTVDTAIEHAVPAPVITDAVFARFRSRQNESFAGKTLAALRNEFGGHEVKKK